MARSRVCFLSLPAPLADRVERVRLSRSVGRASPPLAALLREAVERGLDALEVPPAAERAIAPEVRL